MEELRKWQARKSGEKAKKERRVSISDPQARVMKHADKGFALSYNAQISTDAAYGLIVGVAVTQEANDSAQLLPAVDRRGTATGEKASTDGGRQRIHHAREYREDGRTEEVDFLGGHATRRCAAWRQPTKNRFPPSATTLSAGEKPLCLSGGQGPASRRHDAR